MKLTSALLAAAFVTSGLLADPVPEKTVTYRVEQNATLSEIPAGTKNVKFWVSIPDNERYQDVLDFKVTEAPAPWRVVRDLDRGNRFLLVEVNNPPAGNLVAKVEFTVRRQSVFTEIDPAQAGPITDSLRTLYAEELRLDAPHMTATPEITRLAAETVGSETNVAARAQLLLGKVADLADHYGKDATKPAASVGDATACLAVGGGTCTDMHALFIAMARSQGIPARLQMGYRLREANLGKETNPGYRCWVEYFVPNYGWVSSDIVEADDPKGPGRARWFTGLTERRLWLNEGREFNLSGKTAPGRINTMIVGYAEIDGVPARVLPDGDKKPQLARTVKYTEIAPAAEAAKVAAK
jgi:transglutaminase-like putative cysteine protease